MRSVDDTPNLSIDRPMSAKAAVRPLADVAENHVINHEFEASASLVSEPPGEHFSPNPMNQFDHCAKSLREQLPVLHRELRLEQEFQPIARIAVAAYDAESDLVSAFAQSNIGVEMHKPDKSRLAKIGSLRHLAQTRQARVIDKFKSDIGCLGGLYEKGLRSSLTLPIYSHDQLLGFLFFNATRSNYFSNHIIDRLTPYARAIGHLFVQKTMTTRLVKAATRMALEVSRAHDNETAGHLERMANYARLIAGEGAELWGLSDEFIEHLFWYAPLHDIGKVATPNAILLKPGKLTEAEWDEMKLHVTKGVEIIDGVLKRFTVDALPYIEVARNIIAFHHENVDGSGYPRGVAGNQIPIEGRIAAVADVFDALTSDRPYKRKWSNEAAIDHMRKLIGTKFDGDCLEAFIRRMDEVVEIQARFQETVKLKT